MAKAKAKGAPKAKGRPRRQATLDAAFAAASGAAENPDAGAGVAPGGGQADGAAAIADGQTGAAMAPSAKAKAKAKGKAKARGKAKAAPATATAADAVPQEEPEVVDEGAQDPQPQAKAKAKARGRAKAKTAPAPAAAADAVPQEGLEVINEEANNLQPQAKAKASAKGKAKAKAGPAPAAAAPLQEELDAVNELAQEEEGAALPPRAGRSAGPVGGSLGDLEEEAAVVFCSKCRMPTELGKVRLVGKTTQTYWCRSCQNKVACVYKHWGVTKPPCFKNMPEEAQVAFWREVSASKEDLKAAMLKATEKFSLQKDVATVGGDFLPLSVWTARGYDAEAIAASSEAKDIQVHPVLGTCYRVQLLNKVHVQESGKRQLEQLEASTRVKKLKAGTLQQPSTFS